MIDVHCHLLYQVDDGPGTLEESVAMLQEASRQGIEAIILTPHYRHGMFPYEKPLIEEHFSKVETYANKLGIALYLGTEYHVDSYMMEAFTSGRCYALADSQYILTEYASSSDWEFARKMTQESLRYGYIPILAHVERYGFVMEDIQNLEELRKMGALIQINADAVLGLEGRRIKKLCKTLLKEDLVDVIASDSHGVQSRSCNMRRAYDYVAKRYGKDTAELLFCMNPAQILTERK